ncbi:MAG: hypothetical protein ABIQ66_08725 [Novosphingobium sp.]
MAIIMHQQDAFARVSGDQFAGVLKRFDMQSGAGQAVRNGGPTAKITVHEKDLGACHHRTND